MDEQLDMIARWLDGEDVSLTDDQRRLAEEIRAGEAELAPRLDVDMPDGAMRKARRVVATATSPRRARRVYRLVGSLAVAASIILAAAFLLQPPRPAPTHEKPVGSGQAVAGLLEPLPDRTDAVISLLASDLNTLEREIMMDSGPATEDIELESLERDMDAFWLDDAAPLNGPL